MAAAARAAGVQIVTGDTKVVDRGHGDGVYINTTGIGLVPEGVSIAPQNARPGDQIIVSGMIGEHGIAILSVREGLTFETQLLSDSQPLHDLVAAMLAASRDIHAMRDPTRGGLAATLNEFARASQVGIEIDEGDVPIPPAVDAACEMLGLDPFYVANEGKLVAVAPPDAAAKLLDAMRAHPKGRDAAIIGQVVDAHPGVVTARTGIGGSRVIDTLVGEQLPRICLTIHRNLMAPHQSDPLPRWAWRLSVAALIGTLAFVAALLALSLAGISDPRTAGPLTVDTALSDSLAAASPHDRSTLALPGTLTPPATVELTARLAAGPSDAGYGLWVGSSPSDGLVLAVNGDGYTAIYTLSDGAPTFIREWQTFPRIALQGQPNRLRLDLAGGQATVRLNDEFVASFAWAPPPGPLLIGALVETFDPGGASAAFEHLRIWQGIDHKFW